MSALANRDFAKMNGVGNAIVVVDLRASPVAITPDEARAAASPAGAPYDQLMALYPPRTAGTDALVAIFNNDGSRAGACGNGMRCVTRLEVEATGRRTFAFETDAGVLACTADGYDVFTVDMGPPRFDWDAIPLAHSVDDPMVVDLGEAGLPPAATLSMGNPHAIFFMPSIDVVDLAAVGPRLENDPLFPERANITFAEIIGADRIRMKDHIRMKTWERGAGATLACGSAACATAVAAARRGLTGRRVDLSLPGGDLAIEWRADDDHVLMTGPAELEYRGRFDPALFAAVA